MSKAFTKETDEDVAGDDEPVEDEAQGLPPGTKNYITRAGFEKLQDELTWLSDSERPRIVEVVSWAASNGDRSENGDYQYGKKRLREIDRRTRFLAKRLEIAEIVDPRRQQNLDKVFFGATVTYADEDETEHTITIVGLDEFDANIGRVSWLSPIARALHKAAEGEVVWVPTPNGPRPITVLDILYEIPKAGDAKPGHG